MYTVNGSPFFAGNSNLTIPDLATQLINSIYLVGLTTGLKFFKDSMQQRQRIQEQEKQQIALELNFLKAQVHPHFFFNTLNNLYSLTLQKSDLAPEVVLKLSSLMSYMLYESGASYVLLDKEIANLENYIALEQLRFGNRLSLTFEKEVNPPGSIRIPPLILLTFVENSFKHGMSQTIGDGRIDISLRADQRELLFRIDNSIGELRPSSQSRPSGNFDHPPNPGHQAIPSSNGLGLSNVIRRLDLLYGPSYRLDTARNRRQLPRHPENPALMTDIRCLIVDDEPLAIDVVVNYLQHLNIHTITTANNAVEAFQQLQQEPVDLLFLDIQMPQLTGFDLLSSLPHRPLVVITTAYRDYAVEGFRMGGTRLPRQTFFVRPLPADDGKGNPRPANPAIPTSRRPSHANSNLSESGSKQDIIFPQDRSPSRPDTHRKYPLYRKPERLYPRLYNRRRLPLVINP